MARCDWTVRWKEFEPVFERDGLEVSSEGTKVNRPTSLYTIEIQFSAAYQISLRLRTKPLPSNFHILAYLKYSTNPSLTVNKHL
jgi:hypothetical protein